MTFPVAIFLLFLSVLIAGAGWIAMKVLRKS
jgi:hypothetical protein